jgi:hypothetical protein
MHGGTDAGWVVMRCVNCVGREEPHARSLVLTQTAAKEKARCGSRRCAMSSVSSEHDYLWARDDVQF